MFAVLFIHPSAQQHKSQIFLMWTFNEQSGRLQLSLIIYLFLGADNSYIMDVDDYDINKETLKPAKNVIEVITRQKEKLKTGSTTSRSKEKQVITSFSKKSLQSPRQIKVSNSNHKVEESLKSPEPIKKSGCQSQYYIKSVQSIEPLANVRLEDELKVKDSHIQLLSDKLHQAQSLVRQLTAENKLKSQKIAHLQGEMNALLAKSLKHLEVETIGVNLTYQCEKYKQDQRRLLKMLEQTAEYEYFSKFALMDSGVQFLRVHNQNKKTTIDAVLTSKKLVHFCNCNKQFASETDFWVPEKVYAFGKDFVHKRNGNLTITQFQLLLYELNRFWREREKKIINTLKSQAIHQLQKYKRKVNHSIDKKQKGK